MDGGRVLGKGGGMTSLFCGGQKRSLAKKKRIDFYRDKPNRPRGANCNFREIKSLLCVVFEIQYFFPSIGKMKLMSSDTKGDDPDSILRGKKPYDVTQRAESPFISIKTSQFSLLGVSMVRPLVSTMRSLFFQKVLLIDFLVVPKGWSKHDLQGRDVHEKKTKLQQKKLTSR